MFIIMLHKQDMLNMLIVIVLHLLLIVFVVDATKLGNHSALEHTQIVDNCQ